MLEPISLAVSLQEDQRARWEQGNRLPVEAYLERYPRLKTNPDAVLGLVRNELRLRRQRGEAPQLPEYMRRFGELGARLQPLFDAPRGLEEAPLTRVVPSPQENQGVEGAPWTRVVSCPASLPPTADAAPAPPSGAGLPLVPGYEIVAELGRGGMGIVYLARQLSLKRLVALKMILAGAQADATARARFRTEAEAAARLQHPNVVQIHAVGEHEGRPFLALEYIEGANLHETIARRPQPEREAARLVETLARAVHSMHQRGILHRDLKPNNILLTADGVPKITDFGLAKLLDAEEGPTRTGTLIGTANYMPPEQAAGDSQKVGVASDGYSLGAILYELLTGRAPFQGATLLSTLDQLRNQEPVPPRRLRKSVSPDLQTICLRCLEKEPGKRYPSAEALADDLRRFLKGQPIQARPVAAWRRLARFAARRPALIAWAVGAAALACLLLTACGRLRESEQLARRQAEEKYQQFVRRRDEALFYGLLAPDQGTLFLGSEAEANAGAAESAARAALALAGMDLESGTSAPPAPFPAARQSETAADCYALLLVLADVRVRRPPDPGGIERCREALRILDRAHALGFHTRAYHLRRAGVLEQMGDKEEAEKEKDQASSLSPEGALDLFLIGEEQYRRGDWEGAAGSFDRALVLQPGHFWAQFFLAVCRLKSQDWQAAKAGLNACLAQQPDFVWAYLFRSFADEKLQALPEAEADFQKALQLDPAGDARYVLFLTRGILYFNEGELERAGADFQSAMDLKPDQYNAYLNLAQVRLAQGRFEEAQGQAEKALDLRPPAQVVVGYDVERGRNLLRAGKYEEAVRACDAALELSPAHPPACELRARALLALGRYEQAERSFNEGLESGGETTPDVFRGRGLARMKLGRYPEAAEDYARALEGGPDAELYQHLGWAHFFSDAWRLALRDFSKAIELDPEAGDAYTGRGLARVMLGQYREAVADAEAALRRGPAAPEMMHNIACVFAQAAARAEADSDADGRQALADGYRGRALEAVRRTIEMLPPEGRAPFWRDKILPDPALAPIRAGKDFKRLQEEFAEPR